MQLTKHFTLGEFQCGCGCDMPKTIQLNIVELTFRLQMVRVLLGVPLTITSGYRCTAHNASIGGAKDSAHTKGYAVDIACSGGAARMRLVVAALGVFKRVGVAKSFIHVDIDPRKPQEVLWTY